MSESIERIEEITIPKRRLESILRDYATAQTIHFLKVDVEGAEREVLASSDWDAFRPIVVLVEAVEAWSTTPTHDAWEHILLDAEYEFAAFDGINRFYVDRDHHDLVRALAYPISALDRFVTASVRRPSGRRQTSEFASPRRSAEVSRIASAGPSKKPGPSSTQAKRESEHLSWSLEQADAELDRGEARVGAAQPVPRASARRARAGVAVARIRLSIAHLARGSDDRGRRTACFR